MAENIRGPVVRVEDLMPVRSRVSWGAILAGAVIALAVSLILSLLGSAIGLTVSNNVAPDSMATGVTIWAIVATILAMFAGGYVASQCTVGENKMEAVIHGVIMWGVVLAMIVWLATSGVRLGFNAMMSTAYAGADTGDVSANHWTMASRQSGANQQDADQRSQSAQNAPGATANQTADPVDRETARKVASEVTWWTLAGTILSLVAAIVGALVGAGPSFRVFAVRTM